MPTVLETKGTFIFVSTSKRETEQYLVILTPAMLID